MANTLAIKEEAVAETGSSGLGWTSDLSFTFSPSPFPVIPTRQCQIPPFPCFAFSLTLATGIEELIPTFTASSDLLLLHASAWPTPDNEGAAELGLGSPPRY